MNGVISEENTRVTSDLVEDLFSWFISVSVPASWLTSRPDPELTQALLAAGARPERSGSWSGRPMVTLGPQSRAAGVRVVRVASHSDLDAWLEVAVECGWIETDRDRQTRRALYQALGGDAAKLRHWLALDGRRPVGFASSYLDGDVLDLCNLAVAESHRRRGIGRTLVAARLDDAAARGARTIVSAPSPDGWRLQRTLGFSCVPVVPDTCFYLPVP